jgi:excisionase family DNA binding protein
VQGDRTERLTKLVKARPRGRPKARLSSLAEVAEYLHVSQRTVYRLLDRGLPAIRVGYVLRFDLAVVLAWLLDFTAAGDQLRWQDEYSNLKRPIRRVN